MTRRSADATVTTGVVLAAIFLVALNLRPAVGSVPPVLELIREDLGLSYAAVSLLTTIPVFCMGLFAFAAPMVVRRIGRERTVFWSVALIAATTAARLGGQNAIVLFASTVLVGVGIAICQSVLPSLISLYFPSRIAFATGTYTVSLVVGASLASGLTAPIQRAAGSWEVGLAVWSVVGGIALVTWIPILRSPGTADDPESRSESGRARLPIRDRFAWLITVFFGVVSTTFYSALTWLPSRYIDLGWDEPSAGLLLTVFLVSGLGGAFLITGFADRVVDRRPLYVIMAALSTVSTGVIVVAPEWLPWLWTALFGIGINGLFTLSLTLPVEFSPGTDEIDQLSSMMMGGGYAISAVGPVLIGRIRDITGDHDLAFSALVVLGLFLLCVSTRFDPHHADVSASRK